MQDPLKQGLKLGFGLYYKTLILIRMQDPLKQGLKLDIPEIVKTDIKLFECKIH
ncbi:conserved hypothetical protein [Methanosarcina thermophila]|uniref:Uncharacterized protein n=1 Tax=Methanosarcina thermophila TaxID=2210 RepID=A0A3G9CVG4_METTE|nr:conserved hypothetical protein [Methanosarcina thermophila]